MKRCNNLRDLNFFESYKKKKDKNLSKDFIIYGLAMIILLCLIVYNFMNLVEIKNLSMEVASLKQELVNRKSNRKISEILEKENEIGVLRDKFERLRQLDDFVGSQDIINEYLLNSITVRVPENIFLNSMVFSTNLITLDGIAKDKRSISDFEYKLGEIEYFEDIFIPAISYEYDYYTFIINIKPKEVEIVGSQDND